MPRAIVDNQIFNGRPRVVQQPATYIRRPVAAVRRRQYISEFTTPTKSYKPPTLNPVAQPIKLPVPVASITPQIPDNHQATPVIKVANRKKFIKPLPRAKIGLVVMALLVFGFGVTVSLQGVKTNHKVSAEADKLSSKTITSAVNPPDETKPSPVSISTYQVSPTLPKYLSIPSIVLKARVQRVGVNSSNQLQTARNLYDVGWYENSSKPGDAAGAILIDGHDLGLHNTGVFYNLKKLKPGDNIQITRGDNQLFNFKVVNSKTYDADKVDMAAALTSVQPGKLGLNLITCTGQFNSKTVQFQQRLVVFAVQQ